MKINKRTQLKVSRLINDKNNLGWSLFGNWYDGMTDFEIGENYIKRFFSSNVGQTKKITYDVYINTIRNTDGVNQANTSVEGLGLGIRLASISNSDVQSAADSLSLLSNGLTPSSIGDFRQALIGQATSTPFTDSVVNNSVLIGLANIGDAVINAGSTALSLAESTVTGVGMFAKVMTYVPFVMPLLIGYGAYKYFGVDKIKNLIKGR